MSVLISVPVSVPVSVPSPPGLEHPASAMVDPAPIPSNTCRRVFLSDITTCSA
jgi:hypothetical protein